MINRRLREGRGLRRSWHFDDYDSKTFPALRENQGSRKRLPAFIICSKRSVDRAVVASHSESCQFE